MAAPVLIYGVTALWCWFMPIRVVIGADTILINLAPARAIAITALALAIVHWAMTLRGRLVRIIAAVYGAAAMALTAMFLRTRLAR